MAASRAVAPGKTRIPNSHEFGYFRMRGSKKGTTPNFQPRAGRSLRDKESGDEFPARRDTPCGAQRERKSGRAEERKSGRAEERKSGRAEERKSAAQFAGNEPRRLIAGGYPTRTLASSATSPRRSLPIEPLPVARPYKAADTDQPLPGPEVFLVRRAMCRAKRDVRRHIGGIIPPLLLLSSGSVSDCRLLLFLGRERARRYHAGSSHSD
jgi:hypothetical protein